MRSTNYSRVALTGAVVLTMGMLVGCGGSSSSDSPNSVIVDPPTSAWALRATNEAGLTAYFREALGPGSKNYLGTVWALDGTATAVPGAPAASASPGLASGTTLQEAGVDEADRIKSDGVYVYDITVSASNAIRPTTGATSVLSTLRRQRLEAAAPGAALAAAGALTVPFGASVAASGIYLDSERGQLAVLGDGSAGGGIYDSWFAPQSWGQGVTEIALVSAPAAGALQTRRTLRIDARLIGSRRIGSTLYLVLRSYPQVPGVDPWWPTEKTASNQKLIDAVSITQLLPTLSIDGAPAQPLVDASQCLTQEQNAFKSADVVTIVGIDLAASTHRHGARCFTGGTEAFYLSQQSLYLATTRSSYGYSGIFPSYAAQTSTDIHKFALDGLAITYRGSGNVTGHLGFDQNRKSFRMGEHAGALRVITQTEPTWGGWIAAAPATGATGSSDSKSPGRLTVLTERAGMLATVGELPNAARPQPLGKAGEQLYASRFIGNRGYLVTYRLTDPLYVLDLSDAADPKVAGELEVSGYSDYLFPLSETLLLGVGKDAISDITAGDGRFAWYQGVKVSLIDVSNPATPRETARKTIGRRGTDATVLRDHHGIALQTRAGTVRMGLPVRLHESATPEMKGAASDYYGFTAHTLQRFEIDIARKTLVDRTPVLSNLKEQRDLGNDRSLLWNDQVHWFQDGVWQSGNW